MRFWIGYKAPAIKTGLFYGFKIGVAIFLVSVIGEAGFRRFLGCGWIFA